MHWAVLFAIFSVDLIETANRSSHKKVIEKLLEGYDPSIRPVFDEHEILNVNISVSQLSLLILDQAQETIMFSAEFVLKWKDVNLKWEPEAEGVGEWLLIKEPSIWMPDVTISSSIKIESIVSEEHRLADVRFDGLVRSSLSGVVTNLCAMQVDKFPYDTQSCRIELGSWSYTSDEVFVSGDLETLPKLKGNSEWDILNLTAERFYDSDADVTFKYTNVRFVLDIKRRSLFYVWVLLIPSFIITTVCICGIFTSANSLGDREDKVNLGMSALLSSTVILQIIANSMPKTSSLPLLGDFILAEVFVVAIGVMFSSVVLFVHHRANTRGWKPPSWILKGLSYTGSAKFTRKYMKHSTYIKKKEDNQDIFSAELLASVKKTLQEMIDYLENGEENRFRELAWNKFFDRLDCFLLIFFQITNALVTFFICKH